MTQTPDLHVVPLNDLREHDDRPDCWCAPCEIFDAASGVVILVHNSLDRREHTIEKGVTQ